MATKKHSSIFIGLPHYERQCDIGILVNIAQLVADRKYNTYICTCGGPYIDSNRNRIINSFLSTDFEWLLFWDTDVVVEVPNFLDLMLETAKTFDVKIVTAPYLIKSTNEYVIKKIFPIKGKKTDDGKQMQMYDFKSLHIGDLKDPEFVDLIGMGMTIIHRSVFDKLEKPYFKLPQGSQGEFLSEDYYFCGKLANAGFKIAVDPRVETTHYGKMGFKSQTT